MRMKKRVLIIYATYGSGHKMVANYINDYFRLKGNHDVYLMNIMDYANYFGEISEELFNINIRYRCSNIFTFLYEVFNNKITTMPYLSVFKGLFHVKGLLNEIEGICPDVIIATHFFGVTIAGIAKKKSIINSKIGCVLTDYCSHELWEKNKNDVDFYIVANNKVKSELVKQGIVKNKIHAYGIPVSYEFNKHPDLKYIKGKYTIDNGKKTILFFAGGSLGSNSAFCFLKTLLSKRFDINIIFVSGKNTFLEKKCLNYVKNNAYENVTILGFTQNVNELLSACDIVVTKPGGISITECLKKKKKMILIPGNGGQEIFNARFVCNNNLGVFAKSAHELCTYVESYILGKYDYLDENIVKINDNKAVSKIYKLVLEELEV